MGSDIFSPYLGYRPSSAFGFIEQYLAYPRYTEEENRIALKRLGEWWAWKTYHARFDRCCHGKKGLT